MYILVPHVPVIINESYEPTYIIFFGWDINRLNVPHFRH